MPVDLSVEALVSNDSFYNYCFHKNEADTRYWEDYIFNHPYEIDKIMEARQLVLGLSIIVNQEEAAKNETISAAEKPPVPGKNIYKTLSYIAAAAAITAIIWGITFWQKQNTLKSTAAAKVLSNEDNASPLLFTSAKGERKRITLTDGTLLYLNSGSSLRIDKAFAKSNRDVFLSGEALFDVQHNKSLPFVVHVDSYDVKVLGTLFNVKAYSGDITNEVSLLRGKVEVLNRSNAKKTVLSPNHKLLINYAGAATNESPQTLRLAARETKVLPLSYNKDSLVIETAWSQNRLEIVNEKFGEIKERLERWYDVEIDFEDAEVSDYSFTATFEDETIEQVLKALQYTYHFTYKINKEQITISK